MACSKTVLGRLINTVSIETDVGIIPVKYTSFYPQGCDMYFYLVEYKGEWEIQYVVPVSS